MFSLTIKTDNAAFEDGNGDEIARILAKLTRDDLAGGRLAPGEGGPLYDSNGNRVGRWAFAAYGPEA